MLDDIFDLVSDLLGENKVNTLAGAVPRTPSLSQKKKRVADRPTQKAVHKTPKLTARRDRRGGEDPWDWKEEKPPWEF